MKTNLDKVIAEKMNQRLAEMGKSGKVTRKIKEVVNKLIRGDGSVTENECLFLMNRLFGITKEQVDAVRKAS